MGLITKVRGRMKNSGGKVSKEILQKSRLTRQQEQLFGLHLSKSAFADLTMYKTPHGIYYNLLGCPRGKKPSSHNFQKNPETLILLLLLPLMMGRIGILYACIIYQYPLHKMFEYAKKLFLEGYSHCRLITGKLYTSLDKCENSFVGMNLYTMLNQIVFFMLCDRALGLKDKERVTSMYSLLFYNVLAYCFSYVKEVVEKEDWSMSVNLTPSSQVRHLAMSTTKLVLEWIKAVTFIVTVVCMLLVLGLEQGLEHYTPTRTYIALTLSYYVLTEKIIQETMPNILTYIPSKVIQDQLVGLEKLTSTFVIKIVTLSLNLLVLIPTLTSIKLSLVTVYFNIWLQYKSSLRIKAELEEETRLVQSFRIASDEEIQTHDDVCAVCLTPLEVARVTPCQHMFHTNCLRMCVKTASNTCPICKREFKFE